MKRKKELIDALERFIKYFDDKSIKKKLTDREMEMFCFYRGKYYSYLYILQNELSEAEKFRYFMIASEYDDYVPNFKKMRLEEKSRAEKTATKNKIKHGHKSP